MMKITISKAEHDSQATFDELVRLGILPEPPEDLLFAHNVNSTLPPVGLPTRRRVPLRSSSKFVTLPKRPGSKKKPSIFKNIPTA
jgi:hypothetical protein